MNRVGIITAVMVLAGWVTPSATLHAQSPAPADEALTPAPVEEPTSTTPIADRSDELAFEFADRLELEGATRKAFLDIHTRYRRASSKSRTH